MALRLGVLDIFVPSTFLRRHRNLLEAPFQKDMLWTGTILVFQVPFGEAMGTGSYQTGKSMRTRLSRLPIRLTKLPCSFCPIVGRDNTHISYLPICRKPQMSQIASSASHIELTTTTALHPSHSELRPSRLGECTL